MSTRSWMRASLLLLTIGLLVTVHGQSSTAGSISRTVGQPQVARVADAEVTITHEKTDNIRSTVTTDSDGFYTTASIPAGMYTITVAPTGFKKLVTNNVELHVSENKTVNLDL